MTQVDFSVYGMKLQTDGNDVFEFCRSEGIVGIGWGGIENKEYETVDEVHDAHLAKQERRAKNGKETGEVLADDRLNAPLRYILSEMAVGDYIWVNQINEFALCKVTDDWEVVYNLPESEFERYKRKDIIHFRPVTWVDVPYDLVPGYVRRAFAGQFGTLRQMDKGVNADSKAVLKALHSHDDLENTDAINRATIATKVETADTDRIFDILGSEEVEDIVLSYLQSQGWHIIKSSTSASQAKIECEMRTKREGQSVAGYVQVKTGTASLNPDSYQEYADAGQMFFFVQDGITVEDRESMVAIAPETIQEFIASESHYLPAGPLLKLDFAL